MSEALNVRCARGLGCAPLIYDNGRAECAAGRREERRACHEIADSLIGKQAVGPGERTSSGTGLLVAARTIRDHIAARGSMED